MEAHGLLLGDRKRQEEAGATPEEGERKGPPKKEEGATQREEGAHQGEEGATQRMERRGCISSLV